MNLAMNRVTVQSVTFARLLPKLLSTQASPAKSIVRDSQREFYKKNGYLVLNKLISSDILESCRKHFIDLCNGKADLGPMLLMKEIALMKTDAKGEFLMNKVQDILYDEVFMTYTENPSLLDAVSRLIGASNISAVHSMLINKPPGTTEHPPHQDLHFFPFRPLDKIVGAWTAMEEVWKDNDCLYVLPGSHHLDKLFHHGYPKDAEGKVNKAYHGIVDDAEDVPKEEQRVYLPVGPGDTIFFHPLLVHGSGPNVSKNFRKVISCHYASSECHFISVEGTPQESIARELEGLSLKMYGRELNIEEFWKHRSKPVRGVKQSYST